MNVTDIRIHQTSNTIDFTFNDGKTVCFSALTLRNHTPSADKTPCKDPNVTIVSVEPVGHYAIRIKFSDKHHTGLYTWEYLYQIYQKNHPMEE